MRDFIHILQKNNSCEAENFKNTIFYCFGLLQNCNTPREGKALPLETSDRSTFEMVMHLKITSLHPPLSTVPHVY